MNLSPEFIRQTEALIGKEECGRLQEALQQLSPVSVRINGKASLRPSADKVPWCSAGYYLKDRPAFTFDPLFHAGCYYVQEAASMFLEQVMKQYVTEPAIVLDLCAAPGGKSTHARSMLPEGSLLVANEISRQRSRVLAENLIKWGHPDTVVTCNTSADFEPLGPLFDVIIADVPCSGEGMFRKDPASILQWSERNVELCRLRQRNIIDRIWSSLKPGGLYIYSTCTYNLEENEENLDYLVRRYSAIPLPVDTEPAWGIKGNLLAENLPAFRFFPHLTKSEGFFLSVLRKPADAPGKLPSFFPGKNKSAKASPLARIAGEWLLNPGRYTIEEQSTCLSAFPTHHRELLTGLSSILNVMHAGITLGEVKGKNLIPHHSLAMSRDLRADAFPRVELAYGQAIEYLKKQTLALPGSCPSGFILLAYRSIPLGFAKNVGNRANNLYPSDWRIRTSHTPAEASAGL